MHYLVTGHTGFKGSWLCMLLISRGHKVSGMSLDPEKNSLFNLAKLETKVDDYRLDIRNYEGVLKVFNDTKPDVIVHLAAQSLVLRSYKDPVNTFETNVQGTLNVLRASSKTGSVKAQLIITTDKVYKNIHKLSGYAETDSLGGDDPYSASKAMADILTQSWAKSFASAPTAIARAGNVIGGGDYCEDRIMPDLVSSFLLGKVPILRKPNAVRPWQHVLDCLNGYLILIEKLIINKEFDVWNFGPETINYRTVEDLAKLAAELWGIEFNWELSTNSDFKETDFLTLDSSKARSELNWKDKLNFTESVNKSITWYKDLSKGFNPLELMLRDIKDFERISH